MPAEQLLYVELIRSEYSIIQAPRVADYARYHSPYPIYMQDKNA